MRPLFLFPLAALLFSACQEDYIFTDDNNETPGNEPVLVDNRLIPYFDLFEDEAIRRGYDFDLTALGITGVIENIPEDGVAGTCQYGRHIAHVTVDQNYWNHSSQLSREFVVFHELGHCVLDRDHRDAAFANGICRSIMASGLGDCFDAYNTINREYYLDELFSNF